MFMIPLIVNVSLLTQAGCLVLFLFFFSSYNMGRTQK